MLQTDDDYHRLMADFGALMKEFLPPQNENTPKKQQQRPATQPSKSVGEASSAQPATRRMLAKQLVQPDLDTEAMGVAERPNSATSLRATVYSARTCIDQPDGLKADMAASSIAFEKEREARRLERERRQKARETRKAEQQCPVNTPKAAPTEEEVNSQHPEPSQLPTGSPSHPPADRGEGPAPCTPPLEQSTQQRGDTGEEEEVIVSEAKRRREIRLIQERLETQARAAAELERQRIWDVVRDVVWDEGFAREQILSDEFKARHRCYGAGQPNEGVIAVLQTERMQREELCQQHQDARNSICCFNIVDEEAIRRGGLALAAQRESASLFLLCAGRGCAIELDRVEAVARTRLEEMWNTEIMDIASEATARLVSTVSRELWLAVVSEADARLKIEKSEAEELAARYCGARSSLTLVRVRVAEAQEARRLWAEHHAQNIHQLCEEELGSRVLLQRDEAIALGHIESDECDSRRETALRDEEERKRNVEKAIRLAKLFREQQEAAASIIYQPCTEAPKPATSKKTAQASTTRRR